MMRVFTRTRASWAILLVAGLAWGGCGTRPPGPPASEGDAKRGGALYDKFWKVANADEPTETHALWATRPDQDSNTRTGADTWRCKECHGWDYKGVDGAYAGGSHRTGFAGIFGTMLDEDEVFDLIKTDHGYGEAGLTDDDIDDLAAFVSEGLIDTDAIIDGDGLFTGVTATGEVTYAATCIACHGADGLMIPPGADADHDDWVGLIANDNPWEFQHKVRFGQPGTAMPAQFDLLSLEGVGDLGAHSQTLPLEAAPAGAGDAKRGGALYDKYWKIAGVTADEPTETHALWATRPDQDSNSRVGADTWRCKECHGWDYKGVDGAYAGGSHRTGFAGVFGSTLDEDAVFDLIKIDHGYGDAGLSDEDIDDLTAFVLDGLVDTDDIIGGDGSFIGVAAAGEPAFTTSCTGCHGADGTSVPPGGNPDFDAFVGVLSNDNPWEFQHKVRFGQPGTAMPAQFDLLSFEGVGDLGAHSQTLPLEAAPAGTGDAATGEAFFMANGCTACHGADATGTAGPSLVGADAETLLAKLDGTNGHAGGTVDGITQQDADDLAAWLATL